MYPTLRLASLPLLTSLMATLAVAQTTTVFPSDFTSREGDSVEQYLPLSNGISRTQFIYDRRDLPIPATRTITEVGFRQDASTASTGKSLQLSVYMGGTTFSASTTTSNFANNYNGTARTLVFGPSIVTLPSFTSSTTQQPFWIPLTTPYTVRANENLVVEFVVTANNNANQAFVYSLDAGTFYTEASSTGTGCQTSAGQVPTLTASVYSYVGGYLSYSLQRAPAASLVWLNLDFVPTPPIDAGPFGAPGCTLYVLPQIAVTATGSAGGAANFSFVVPSDPALFHAVIYGQSAIFDLFANNLGFSFTNRTQLTLGMYPMAAAVYVGASATATTGSLRPNYAPVTMFRWN